MDPFEAASLVESFVIEDGEPVTFSRLAVDGSRITANTKAVMRQYRTTNTADGIVQGLSVLTIYGDALPALIQQLGSPPRRNDKVLAGGIERNVEGAEIIRIGTTMVRGNVTVSG